MQRRSTNLPLLFIAVIITAMLAMPSGAVGGARGRNISRGVQPAGPDVICSEIFGFRNWGHQSEIAAFSLGTRACNVGTEPVSWRAGTPDFPDPRHPVIAQNMYRYHDGRFRQIGQSWLKHGFCAVDGDTMCMVCKETEECEVLGVGCSDPYAAELNGYQGSLGPKHQVNPSNGGMIFPPANPGWSGPIARRLQVAVSELPGIAPPPGERYYVEAHYVAADDALSNNDANNVSYRGVSVSTTNIAGFIGDTVVGRPAIYAWQEIDPQVQIVVADVPQDGRYILACRVRTNAREFDYEFALYNLNSDKAGHAFAVPARAGVLITDSSFNDVAYHSGEPYDNADWTAARDAGELRWSGAPFAKNANANALRWGTMYNFRFHSPRPPRAGQVRLELFKPHSPGVVHFAALTPTPNEDVNVDGLVNMDDVFYVLSVWAGEDAAGDVTRDGVVDVFDLFAVLSAWGA